jgi:hypothetical protein
MQQASFESVAESASLALCIEARLFGARLRNRSYRMQ